MKMEFYRPKNEGLRKYIAGYYFISPDENSKPLHYWTFPNNFFIVSVSLNIEIEIGASSIVVKQSNQQNMVANYVSRYIEPMEVTYKGPINEITMYFEPLGINHFVDDANALLQQKNKLDFNPFADFKESLKEILDIKDREAQRNSLEQYWLSKLQPKTFGTIASLIADVETELKIDDIARKYNFSRQYLNKLFIKNIGKSPSEYRKIHRFRKAIGKQKDLKNLTELSYETLFYDQSHLIKDFKQLTHVSPNSFFKKVDTNRGNIWLFI